MFKLCFYIQEYQPRSILEHHFEHKNNKTAQLKNEQFYIFSLSIEAQQVKPKMPNKTVLKHRVIQISKLINRTAADTAREEMANGVQVVSQCHRQEEAAGPFVHLD